jgi:hypothetical protein
MTPIDTKHISVAINIALLLAFVTVVADTTDQVKHSTVLNIAYVFVAISVVAICMMIWNLIAPPFPDKKKKK